MKIIEPSVVYLDKVGKRPSEFIEFIGRTCYKSTDLITEDSSVKFFQNLIDRKHYAMTEHYWIHLHFKDCGSDLFYVFISTFANMLKLGNYTDVLRYLMVTFTPKDRGVFVSMPLRVALEWKDRAEKLHIVSLPSMLEATLSYIYPDKYNNSSSLIEVLEDDAFIEAMKNSFGEKNDLFNHEVTKHKTHTILFVCDRGVSHELVRHRPCSFAQESTRYCNYSKDKFGNEITVIKPLFFGNGEYNKYGLWKTACENAEDYYFALLEKGATPQEARSVLPNSLKTEIVVTANEVEWQHIVNLRYHGTTGAPHPQMKEVMSLAYEELIKVGANIE